MKVSTAFRILSGGLFALALAILPGCGGKETAPEPEPDVTSLLTAGQWNVTGVTVDGAPSTMYPGMTIIFSSAGTYSSANGGGIWKAAGAYKFQNENELFVDNDFTATITEITSGSLKLSFNWTRTTVGPGRETSVKGFHVFTFAR